MVVCRLWSRAPSITHPVLLAVDGLLQDPDWRAPRQVLPRVFYRIIRLPDASLPVAPTLAMHMSDLICLECPADVACTRRATA